MKSVYGIRKTNKNVGMSLRESSGWLPTAQQIVADYDLETLRHYDLAQELEEYCFSATYPPLKALESHLEGGGAEPFKPALPAQSHVYLHFPFCSGLCSFCHFNVVVAKESRHFADYLNSLRQEINRAAVHGPRVQARSLYFGGGTPSLMSLREIDELLKTLHRHFVFTERVRVTLELHPEVMASRDGSFLSELLKLGINRVSVGVQDFSSPVLTAIRRRHSAELAEETILKAKAAGLLVNLDLMTPLPLQTEESWERTLTKAFSLDVDSVTLYTTSLRDSMPLSRDIRSGLPFSPEKSYLFYTMAQLAAGTYGYREKKSRWFQKGQDQTQSEDISDGLNPHLPVLGFGCGAYGYANGTQYSNFASLSDYMPRIEEHRSVVWRSLSLSRSEQLHREIVFSARDGVLNSAKFEILYGVKIEDYLGPQLAILQKCGLISRQGRLWRLTRKGKMLSDEVAKLLVSHQLAEKMRLSLPQTANSRMREKHLNHFYEIV